MKTKRMTKKEATIKLNELYNARELRKNKVQTTYKKVFFDERLNAFRVLGKSYDYSIYAL